MLARMVVVGVLAAAGLGAAAAHPPEATAQLVATQQARLVATNPDWWSTRHFGMAVDIDGDTAVVGDRDDGSVTTFVRSGAAWDSGARLAHGGSRYGSSVGLSQSSLIVGDPFASAPGRIYSRAGHAWDTAGAFVSGGPYVAIDGDLAATLAQAPGTPGALICVYQRTGGVWSRIAQIPCVGGYVPGLWVRPIAVSGNTIVVADGPYDGAQTIQVYTVGGGIVSLDQTLASPNSGKPNTLDVDADTMVLSASSGVVQVYRRVDGVWSLEQALTPGVVSEGLRFGDAVAIDGDTVVVGDSLEHTDSTYRGAVFVYRRSGSLWTEELKITGPVPMALNYDNTWAASRFGTALALRGRDLIVGAPEELSDTGSGYEGGAAYVYTLSDTPGGLAVTPGTNVTVTDPDTGVRAVFDNVTSGGTLTVVKSAAPNPAPAGRHLVGDACYDVSFSGTYTGEIELTLPYPIADNDPRGFHHAGGTWVDVHTSGDTAARTVTLHTTSLSPFGVYGADASEPIAESVPASSAASLIALGVLGVVGVGWMARRRSARAQ